MIRYQLRCLDDHEFDAWFRDSKTYDKQAKKSQVICPHCGSSQVVKAPMAPAVSKSARRSDGAAEVRATEVAEQILQAVTKIRNKVEADCDYVGDQFAEEARRIHYGEADERGIYGEATIEEAMELDDEGIEIMALPGDAKPANKKKKKLS